MIARHGETDRDEATSRLCHSVTHSAEILDISESAIRRMIRNKQLDAVYFGASLRITAASLYRVAQVGTRRQKASGKKSVLSKTEEPRRKT